jgi:RND family efflux transporter MFP subunit
MKRNFYGLLLAAALLCSSAGAAEYPARIQWAERLSLSTPVSGVITRVAVRSGETVARGDLLLELDPRLHRARLQRAKAALEQARQEHEEAQRELGRTQEMFDRTLLSIHDLQVAQIDAAGAEAGFRRAEAELVQAQLKLEYSRLQAPYAARVVALPARVGETVVSRFQARSLVVLAPSDRMGAHAWLDAQQIAALKPGDPVRVRVGEEAYPGRVMLLGMEPEGDAGQVLRYRLEVQFELPDAMLMRPGQSALIETQN